MDEPNHYHAMCVHVQFTATSSGIVSAVTFTGNDVRLFAQPSSVIAMWDQLTARHIYPMQDTLLSFLNEPQQPVPVDSPSEAIGQPRYLGVAVSGALATLTWTAPEMPIGITEHRVAAPPTILETSAAGPSPGSGPAARAMPTRRTDGWEPVDRLGPAAGTAAQSGIAGSELHPFDCPVAPTSVRLFGCAEPGREPLDKVPR